MIGRSTAVIDGDFVIFLVGGRFICPWKIRKIYQTYRVFCRVKKELDENPECGYLSGELWLGRTILNLEYWRSLEQLWSSANGSESEHFVAWRDFNKTIAESGSMGIYHEAYLVKSGNYETIYRNMPPFGLGKVARLIDGNVATDSARDRFDLNAKEK